MDPHEYDKLVRKLDAEIEDARKDAEVQRRREDLDRRAKILREQIEGLQRRRTTLVQLGRHEMVKQIDPHLAEAQKEAADVQAVLIAYGPTAGSEEALRQALGAPRPDLPPAQPLDSAARTEAMALIDEVEAGKSALADLPQERRGPRVRIWALRWRILAERIGQSIARNDPAMRKAYAVIMETRERYPGLPFMEALDPRRHGEWEKELAEAKRAVGAL